ncbi:PQQ-binding-like beta-propeller repeat protein [Kitasatospora sp. NPDC048722]|uniref:outer membrane protein assembly factor BamB family protein n=1 Tax=Kitasatospora sp. NPDC048722 TaxID=3155639 RepID=UPI0033E28D0E
MSAAGGVGALAVAASVGWWARHDDASGPRIWSTTAAGGRVALNTGAQDGLYVSGYDGRVSALDPRTGAVRWSSEITTPGHADTLDGCPMAVAEGLVCVTSLTRLQVLDAATGAVRWQVEEPDTMDAEWGDGPAVAGGRVFAVYGGALRSYDAATGELRWSGLPDTGGAPAAVGATVYTAGTPGGVRAFDARSGEQRWEQNAVGKQFTGPVVRSGGVFVADFDQTTKSSTVYALDAATGRVLWRQAKQDTGTLAVSDGTVLLLGGSRLTALDAETGAIRWTTAVPLGLGLGGNAVTATADTVYIGTNDDRVYAHDLATGRLRWQDEPKRTGNERTGIYLAAAGTAVYQGGRRGVHALGAVPSA